MMDTAISRSPSLHFLLRIACPACNSVRLKDRFEQPFVQGETWAFIEHYYGGRITAAMLGDATYVLAECMDCGLHLQRQVLDGPGLEFLYETAISPTGSLAKREDAGSRFFAGIMRSASRVSQLVPAERARSVRVLDFGMGWGHWAAAAKALGHTVFGAEISGSRIAFAASLGVPSVSLQDLGPGSFDYIHADQVFEHLVDPAETLESLVALLRPGGVIRIAVPDGNATMAKLKARWRASKDELHPLEHINAYTSATLDGMALRAGLAPVRRSLRTRLKQAAKRRRAAPGGFYRKMGSTPGA